MAIEEPVLPDDEAEAFDDNCTATKTADDEWVISFPREMRFEKVNSSEFKVMMGTRFWIVSSQRNGLQAWTPTKDRRKLLVIYSPCFRGADSRILYFLRLKGSSFFEGNRRHSRCTTATSGPVGTASA